MSMKEYVEDVHEHFKLLWYGWHEEKLGGPAIL